MVRAAEVHYHGASSTVESYWKFNVFLFGWAGR